MMKRIFAVILMLSLMLSTTSFAAEAENVAVDVRDITVLEALGIIDGTGLGVGNAGSVVSRSEFVRLAMSIAFPDYVGAGSVVSPFSDVDSSAVGYGLLCSAYELGIISGDGNGSFNPGNPIEYEQAVKIIVTLLGYNKDADAKGGYPTGYNYMARRLKLDSGISDSEKSGFTFSAAATLLVNALETEVKELRSIEVHGDNTYIIKLEAGDTLMHTALDINKGNGVLSSNRYTGLAKPATGGSYEVTIGNFNGMMYGAADQEKYLGYEVNYYYQETELGNVVLYMEPDSINKVVTIPLYEASYSNNKITYYNELGTKKLEADLPASIMYIKNGKAFTDEEYKSFEKILTDAIAAGDGDVKLIDNDSDGKYEVLSLNIEKNLVVNAVDAKNEFISDKFNNANVLDLEDAEDFIIWDANYKDMQLSDLKAGMVITYVKSEDDEYVRGIISTTTANGEIKKLSLGGDVKKISIGDTEYKLSGSVTKNGFKFNAGDRVMAYLNYKGEIIALDAQESQFEYGYIINATEGNSLANTAPMLKMLMSNGVIETVYCEDGFSLDGISCDTQEKIDAALAVLKTPQVVRYLLGSNGNIKMLDTSVLAENAGEGEKGNSLAHLMPMVDHMQYFTIPKLFVGDGYGVDPVSTEKYGQMILAPGAKVMVVPDATVTDAKDEDYYVTSESYFQRDGNYTVQGYVSDKDDLYPELVLVVLSNNSAMFTNKNVVLVTGKKTALNSDGDVVDAIDVMKLDGSVGEYLFDSGSTLASKITEGDIMDLALNVRGDIADIKKFYSYEKRNLTDEYAEPETYHSSDIRPEVGKVYSVEDNRVAYIPTYKAEHTEMSQNIKYKDLMFFNILSKTKVYVFEKQRGNIKCELGTAADIRGFKDFGEGSDIFFYTSQAQVSMVVVYK